MNETFKNWKIPNTTVKERERERFENIDICVVQRERKKKESNVAEEAKVEKLDDEQRRPKKKKKRAGRFHSLYIIDWRFKGPENNPGHVTTLIRYFFILHGSLPPSIKVQHRRTLPIDPDRNGRRSDVPAVLFRVSSSGRGGGARKRERAKRSFNGRVSMI